MIDVIILKYERIFKWKHSIQWPKIICHFFFVNERGEHTSIAIKTKLNNKTIGCFRTLFLMALTDQFQSSSGQNGNWIWRNCSQWILHTHTHILIMITYRWHLNKIQWILDLNEWKKRKKKTLCSKWKLTQNQISIDQQKSATNGQYKQNMHVFIIHFNEKFICDRLKTKQSKNINESFCFYLENLNKVKLSKTNSFNMKVCF